MKKTISIALLALAMLAMPSVAKSQIYAKVNALYACVGIINPQLEFVVGPHSSISIDPMFSPHKTIKWGNRDDIHARFGIFQTEYRFYINREVRGFYISANAGMHAFDMTRPFFFQNGKTISFEQGYGKGWGLMVGLGIGYSHTFKERWVVDAFFAFDRMWSHYNDYKSNGEVNLFPAHQHEPKYPDPYNGSAEWLPSKIGVSIGYKIFDPSQPRKTIKQRRIEKILSK